MTYIKVNDTLYPAVIDGNMVNRAWDGRQTKRITLEATYAEAAALLPTGTPWAIVQKDSIPVYDPETGEQTGTTEEAQEWDNSEYSMSGAITDNRDGTVSITMGKPTEVETLRSQLEDAETAAKILLGEAE